MTIEQLREIAKEARDRIQDNVWIENDAEGFTGYRWEKYGIQLRIVTAANRYGDFIIPGVRHCGTVMKALVDAIGEEVLLEYHREYWADKVNAPSTEHAEQGFIDQYSQYRTRKEAFVIAKAAGQLIHSRMPDQHYTELYSEFIY